MAASRELLRFGPQLRLLQQVAVVIGLTAVAGAASAYGETLGTWDRPPAVLQLAQASPPATPAPEAAATDDALRDQIRQAIRYYQSGRCVDAIPVAQVAASRIRQRHGVRHPDLIAAVNIRALCHKALGQYQEAEGLYREAIGLAEKVYGSEAKEVAIMLDNLAGLYFEQQRIVLSEPLRRRALEIFLKTTGPESASTLISTQNLGALLYSQGKHAEAERHYRQALAIAEKVYQPNDPQKARLLDNLAGAVRSQDRLAEAGPIYERAIAIFKASLGAEHPDTALALQNHAILLGELGQYAESERQLLHALAIHERNFGPHHPVLVIALNTLSNGFIDQGRWQDAVVSLRRAVGILAVRRSMAPGGGRSGSGSEQRRNGVTYRKLVQALLHTAQSEPAILDEAFRVAQTALGSEASIAVAQMAARFASGNPKIGRVLRERQDLVEEAETLDHQLIGAASLRREQRNPNAEDASRGRIANIRQRVAEIDAVLVRDFPGYAALADPQPLSISQAQAMQHAGESLVVTLDVPQIGRAPDESFVFVVTREAARWATVPLGAAALGRAVEVLRCGLDAANWQVADCPRLLGQDPGRDGLPFDLSRAHGLYRALFGGIEDLIRDRELLMVMAGPLTKLPPHVLVTEAPAKSTLPDERYRRAAWLGRRQPITVLPSVASLQVLRSLAKSSAAPSPMIGFGNPLLTGADDTDRSAWAKTNCADIAPALVSNHLVATAASNAAKLYRGSLADVETVRRQVPLPETADELCAVARSVGAPDSAVNLGARATERAIKTLSQSGELAQFRMLHFATHGLVAGDLPGLAEPALLLTPPDRASEEDDGLLTASEITQLRLNADWVIMSACNTAAGGAAHADALSGLARAFFYAGARSLLVSHWAVSSDATVKLIKAAVAALKDDPRIGRSEAMRRAMLVMLDRGELSETHPAMWAPFVLVGEGAGAFQSDHGTGTVSAQVIAQPPTRSPTVRRPAAGSKLSKQPAATKPVPEDWKSGVFRN